MSGAHRSDGTMLYAKTDLSNAAERLLGAFTARDGVRGMALRAENILAKAPQTRPGVGRIPFRPLVRPRVDQAQGGRSIAEWQPQGGD
jgi:hypothetical protein